MTRISEIKARLDAASGRYVTAYAYGDAATFLTSAYSDIQFLIGEVERLEAQIKRLTEEIDLYRSGKCIHSGIAQKLATLKQCCETALAIAENHKTEWKHDAINWGDLRCVNASLSTEMDGSTVWQVFIEEAAPDAQNLQVFVQEHLMRHGWQPVEIFTEW